VWLTNGATLIRKELQVLSPWTVRKWTVFHSLHQKKTDTSSSEWDNNYICQYNAKLNYLNIKLNNIIVNVVL